MTERDDDWLEETDEEANAWLRDQPPPVTGDLLSPVASEPDADWLSLQDPGENEFLRLLNDDSTPKTNFPAVPVGTTQKFADSIRALQRLRPNQRTFIRALVQEGGSVSGALRLYNARHAVKLTHSQVGRWCHNPDYYRALKDAKDYFLDMHGIDPSSVMLKVATIYEKAMEPVPILHQGRPTGYYQPGDRSVALKAAELQGKHLKMWGGDEGGNRVTVQIVNLSSKEKKAEPVNG